jgi:phosphatidylcholine synthase
MSLKPEIVGPPPSIGLQALAWAVHLYTAMGLVLAAGIAVLLVRGGADAFRLAFVMMLVATLVDATDGTLARRVQVKRVLPYFDGRKLDDIIDYLTYTFLPIGLIWRAGLLPPGQEGWLILVLLASIYGFCQEDAKTPDGYFLGFPSYWNIVAFYLFAIRFDPWVALGIVVILAIFTFIPSLYLYPTMPGRLNMISNGLAVPWTISLAWMVWAMPGSDGSSPVSAGLFRAVSLASLAYPVYYLGASWIITLRRWFGGSGAQREATTCS